MGGGSWTRDAFASYVTTATCMSYDAVTDSVVGSYSTQDIYKQNKLDPALNPYGVVRECRDSDEHPNTIPVILALDVTGSMGGAAVEVAKTLNTIMTGLYKSVTDVEFMVMGIGDLAYDRAPIQASQFESDIRIAEQLDKIWFEGGGGGNAYESYTAAWYFGTNQTDLDCWKRGKKGIIITMGDEVVNPYLPARELAESTGAALQGSVDTKVLYQEVSQKYDVFHLVVDHGYSSHVRANENYVSFADIIKPDHVRIVTLNDIADAVIEIVTKASSQSTSDAKSNSGMISW